MEEEVEEEMEIRDVCVFREIDLLQLERTNIDCNCGCETFDGKRSI